MSELVVLAFDDEASAERLRRALKRLQAQQLLTLDDAAVVVRRRDGQVKVTSTADLAEEGTLGVAFWTRLIDALLRGPAQGVAMAATPGTIAGAFQDFGVDDQFVQEVASAITPGHSALFLLVREARPEKLVDELKPFKGKILQTSLSKDDELRLRAAFGEQQP